jgi:hypothetical protein
MTNLPRSTSERYVSHQLLNALACIQQFGSILGDGLAGELSTEQREYVGIMLENASQIRQLLGSVWDGADGSPEECGLEV